MRRDVRRAWERDVATLDDEGVAVVESLLRQRRWTLDANRPRVSREEELAIIARRAAAIDRRRGVMRPGRPARTDIDRDALVAALARSSGKIRPVARELGIPRDTLARHAQRVPAWTYSYGPGVLAHAALLHASRVSPEVARLRGYESAMKGSHAQGGLLVPLWTVHSRRAWTQVRHDTPHGRRYRYENAPDAHAIVDCSPAARPRVLDSTFPLYVTESPRKADAAVSLGLACVDFPGVRMMSLDDETWDYIGVRDRDVRVCFDGDADEKPDVGAAEWWLSEYLKSKGARVTVYRIPWGMGLDDYLAAGKSIDALPVVELSADPPAVRWRPWRKRDAPKGTCPVCGLVASPYAASASSWCECEAAR